MVALTRNLASPGFEFHGFGRFGSWKVLDSTHDGHQGFCQSPLLVKTSVKTLIKVVVWHASSIPTAFAVVPMAAAERRATLAFQLSRTATTDTLGRDGILNQHWLAPPFFLLNVPVTSRPVTWNSDTVT